MSDILTESFDLKTLSANHIEVFESNVLFFGSSHHSFGSTPASPGSNFERADSGVTSVLTSLLYKVDENSKSIESVASQV